MLSTHCRWQCQSIPSGCALARCSFHELPSVLEALSQRGVNGYRCQPFYFVPNAYDTVHLCVPKALEPRFQGFPLLFPKLHTQDDQLCLSVWLICRELSHIGGPLRMPPWSLDCLCFTFFCTTASLPSRDPQSRNIRYHRHLPPRCQRWWVLLCHGVLALTPMYVAVVLLSISAHCIPV